jgi:hypothetical protein
MQRTRTPHEDEQRRPQAVSVVQLNIPPLVLLATALVAGNEVELVKEAFWEVPLDVGAVVPAVFAPIPEAMASPIAAVDDFVDCALDSSKVVRQTHS